MKAQLRLNQLDGDKPTEVIIDGRNVANSITGLHLRATPEGNALILKVDLRATEVDGDMHVDIPQTTRETLLALGWTPPKETE